MTDPSRLQRLAVKQGKVAKNEVNRVGGEPIGMTSESWPRYEGEPMCHVITLSRELIVPFLPVRVAAVAVFINSLGANAACTPETEDTQVVFLTQQDVERGTTAARATLGAPLDEELAQAGTIVHAAAEYSVEELKASHPGEEGEEAGAVETYLLDQLGTAIGTAPVGGLSAMHTGWLQDPEAPPGQRVLFFFTEALVPELNLGDAGVMYVTADADCTTGAAWWQCG